MALKEPDTIRQAIQVVRKYQRAHGTAYPKKTVERSVTQRKLVRVQRSGVDTIKYQALNKLEERLNKQMLDPKKPAGSSIFNPKGMVHATTVAKSVFFAVNSQI